MEFDPEPRMLAIRLGLGDLNTSPVHHGYANGCECLDCTALSQNVSPRFRGWLENPDESVPMPKLLKRAPRQAAQPWQPKRIAA